MTAAPPPADELDLHAYADGQLPVERIPVVEARLAADPAARARVSSWRRQNELIVRLHDGGVELALPPRLRPGGLPLEQRWSPSPRRAVTAAAVAATIGLGAGWLAHGLLPAGPTALDSLARVGLDLHRMALRGDLPIPIEHDARQLQVALSQALAHDVQLPDLGRVGLHLVGGRALPIAVGQTAAQILYADGSGARFTLYLVRPEAPEATAFQPLPAGGAGGLVWPYEEFLCLLIGDAAPERLSAISHVVQAELDADDPADG